MPRAAIHRPSKDDLLGMSAAELQSHIRSLRTDLSGRPKPSPAHRAITKRIEVAEKLLQLQRAREQAHTVPVSYLLYFPVEEIAPEIEVAGPLCIKTTVPAYVGFATKALAKKFCARWGIEGAKIIKASELGVDYPAPSQDIRKIVRFPDAVTLATYMQAPEAFPCEQYLIST